MLLIPTCVKMLTLIFQKTTVVIIDAAWHNELLLRFFCYSSLSHCLIPCIGYNLRWSWSGVRLWEFGKVLLIVEFSAPRSLLAAVHPRSQKYRGTRAPEIVAELSLHSCMLLTYAWQFLQSSLRESNSSAFVWSTEGLRKLGGSLLEKKGWQGQKPGWQHA